MKELLKLFTTNQNIVIDGLRFSEDHSFLREKFGLSYFHIHICADDKKRKERYYTREVNDKNFEEANSHTVEQEISNLQKFADVVVNNNSSIADLENELTQIVSQICQFR